MHLAAPLAAAGLHTHTHTLLPPRPPCLCVQAGGQRLVQVVVYLNSLQPDQGGETRFFNPLLKGLAVQVGGCGLCGQLEGRASAAPAAGRPSCTARRGGQVTRHALPCCRHRRSDIWLRAAGASALPTLCVQPRQGDALVFFPAFADGRFDDRMAHAGMPVKYGEGGRCG